MALAENGNSRRAGARTMLEKIWSQHVVSRDDDGTDLIHIDRHMLHEITAFKAFDDLRAKKLRVRSPGLSMAVQDHILSTQPGRGDHSYEPGTSFIQAQRANAREFGIPLVDVQDAEQGIVHVIGPELGFTLPGTTLVCGDSHTCTHGALGALAFGIGSSDVAHVLATQTLAVRRPQTFRVRFDGSLGKGVSAKDLALFLIRHIGQVEGYAAEYTGPAVKALTMEGRMTLCNMSIEWGARIGMVAPDDATYQYLHGRKYVPTGKQWDEALSQWRALGTDQDASFDREISFDACEIEPQVTWGTTPEHAAALTSTVPDASVEADAGRRKAMERALEYMDLAPGTALLDIPIQRVFIGSCTNGRIEDLRNAAQVVKGRTVAVGVRAIVVPGSTLVKRQAEAEGLDRIFKTAGFEWRESACSLCAGVNEDIIPPKLRCVATSNRNFEGRQGRDARTHLASPATAAASAIAGRIADPRTFLSHV